MNEYGISYSYYDDADHDWDNFELDYESNYDLQEACVIPTLQGIGSYVIGLLFWNLAFRAATQIVSIHINFCHLISITCGLAVIYTIINVNLSYIVLFCILSYSITHGILYSFKKFHAPIISIFGILLLVLCELLINGKTWHHIRGVFMIMVMKMISLAFDLSIGRVTIIPNLMSYCGYLLCPANSIFGPWMSYKQYVSVFHKSIWNWILIPQSILKGALSLFFLVLSSCWINFLIPSASSKWFLAYRDALSFRASNYFISSLAETAMITGGYSQNSKILSGSISNPLDIELPRSLLQIVIHWNVPMHMWLKTYIFKEARRFGVFFAICSTYIVSSLLHGLNFKLAAVLLSIGLFSYIEFKLRNKLANIFNACISVYKCTNCMHVYRKKNVYVVISNLFFSCIAMLHLAYLGMVFGSTEGEDSDLSYKHTLNKWRTLDYMSHWLALIFYIFYLLV